MRVRNLKVSKSSSCIHESISVLEIRAGTRRSWGEGVVSWWAECRLHAKVRQAASWISATEGHRIQRDRFFWLPGFFTLILCKRPMIYQNNSSMLESKVKSDAKTWFYVDVLVGWTRDQMRKWKNHIFLFNRKYFWMVITDELGFVIFVECYYFRFYLTFLFQEVKTWIRYTSQPRQTFIHEDAPFFGLI